MKRGLDVHVNSPSGGEKLDLTQSVLYETFARSSWGIALLVQIIICQCGLGGKSKLSIGY